MRYTPAVLIPLLIALLVPSAAHADVLFSMHDGRVVIVAKDASVAEILAAWARIGRTKIVNADRLPTDLITLELQDVGEHQALDVLLRATSGYIALPRAVADPGASLFDRIAIMPPSVAPVVSNVSPTPANPRRAPSPVAEPVASEPPSPVARTESEKPTDGVNDESPAGMFVGGALSPAQLAERQSTFSSRQMLEVVNPRNFKLPTLPGSAATATSAGALRPGIGAAVPGVITVPAPQPDLPRVPRQPLNR